MTEEKTYYYAGPPLDTARDIVMSGTVTVSPPQQLVLDLMLTVDDIEAEYVPSSGEFKACTTFIALA